MTKSAVSLIVLIGLLMFQSIWNVAAAFCQHEDKLTSSSIMVEMQLHHFGHHQTVSCGTNHQDDSKQQFAKSLTQTNTLPDDHQDHLPSFTHLILPQLRISQISNDMNSRLILLTELIST